MKVVACPGRVVEFLLLVFYFHEKARQVNLCFDELEKIVYLKCQRWSKKLGNVCYKDHQ